MKSFAIRTFGCQMNVRDSEIIREKLLHLGLREESSTSSELVVINTCTVREKAEKKAVLYIKESKKKGKIVVVSGCLAQRDKENLLEIGADIVLGTKSFFDIDKFILEWQRNGRVPISLVDRVPEKLPFSTGYKENQKKISSFVNITLGCDNFCTFCVVPYTRGREISRNAQDIIDECKELVLNGTKEITLLGQNVNSYFDGKRDFAELLYLIQDNIKEYFWLNYISPHPQDISYKLIKAVKENEKVCNWFHIPLQSGSTKILMKMKRNYTKEEYLDLITMIREEIPYATITTDIIVGYPGEDEKDFIETIDVIQRVEYDMAFMFKYSPRPNTPAYYFGDTVPEKIKEERLKLVIETVNKGILNRRNNMRGKKYEILTIGVSKKNSNFSLGKTKGNIKVIIPQIIPKGKFLSGVVKEIKGHTPLVIPLREIYEDH